MFEIYDRLAEQALQGEAPSEDDGLWVLEGEDVQLLPLLQAAYAPREKHFGRTVMVHVLNNVQNGLCAEDCGYCAQSKSSEAAIRKYPMKSDEEILAEAENAARAGASRYCMVLSGRGATLEHTRHLAELIRTVKETLPIEVCLSAGLVNDEQARILAEVGLDRLNHNLNTSASHYPEICSTHSYADRVETLQAAKNHGIGSCSGMIVGMGESSRDILEVAFELRELEVPSIPVNFLIPIEGNRVLSDGSLTPERCLRALSLVRLVNPGAEVRVAGGREGHLRAMGSLALWPANSLFIEGYLTTRGDDERDTYQMIEDAGFEVHGNPTWQAARDAGVDPASNPTPDAAEPAQGSFRLRGGDGEILKPEISRPTRGV